MSDKKVIYYDSLTGNVERFINKLSRYGIYKFEKINGNTKVDKKSHFITRTTGIGEISKQTQEFLEFEDNYKNIESVAVSGNMNWGANFGLAGDKIEKKYGIPLIMKFELSGTKKDIEVYLERLRSIGKNE